MKDRPPLVSHLLRNCLLEYEKDKRYQNLILLPPGGLPIHTSAFRQ